MTISYQKHIRRFLDPVVKSITKKLLECSRMFNPITKFIVNFVVRNHHYIKSQLITMLKNSTGLDLIGGRHHCNVIMFSRGITEVAKLCRHDIRGWHGDETRWTGCKIAGIIHRVAAKAYPCIPAR